MGLPDIFKIVFSLLKAGKEQFFGKLDFGTLIRKNPVTAVFFLVTWGLFGLIVFMSTQALDMDRQLRAAQTQLSDMQSHFTALVPDGTPAPEVTRTINQALFRQEINYQRCVDDLAEAKRLLLAAPGTHELPSSKQSVRSP